ncbi:enoyl-CoA hydratase/isomerase family protein [Aquisalimonas lutea]|uniref:enoyl-CoA hydratase/isomerase family protein n=1 Tax=Aquisalimonas lutea TaxID=1327750 RepID=UPI0025B541A3|nr:enoyl-CoA hydratase/isomerase family protein [Aquisalimonas lutea]MDN3518728.1 enoyl-CoA hydratase/isomerase family protein [Aquisalimonas lutea]
MQDEAAIVVEHDAGVATVTMNRPDRHNAFDDTLIAELTGILRDLAADDGVRVVVLAGRGKSFSAGADLNWMRRMAGYTREQNEADALALAELMETLDGLAKPTIARVHGAAFGGGVGLVACCDIAVAADAATFCLSEVKLGLIPAAISPYVVKAMGEQQARRYFVTAERFDAAEARRVGLIHEHVPAEGLDERIHEFLRQMRGNGPEAMAASKDLARAVGRAPVDDTMIRDTARRIAAIRVGAEGQEGISAFLEKRKPSWLEG